MWRDWVLICYLSLVSCHATVSAVCAQEGLVSGGSLRLSRGLGFVSPHPGPSPLALSVSYTVISSPVSQEPSVKSTSPGRDAPRKPLPREPSTAVVQGLCGFVVSS